MENITVPNQLRQYGGGQQRAFVVTRKGNDRLLLRLEDIACFFLQAKIAFALTRDGKKYLLEENLTQLESMLDPHQFFRVSRQAIVSIHYIRRFRNFGRLRIEVELDVPVPYTVLTSQPASALFRKWIYNQ